MPHDTISPFSVSPENRAQNFLDAYAAWGAGGPPVQDPDAILQVDPEDFSIDEAIFRMRLAYIPRFGFSVPTARFSEVFTALDPVIEIGAGRGFLSLILRQAGVHVIATDIDPHGLTGYPAIADAPWVEVKQMDAVTAVSRCPHRTVLCSWPSLHGAWIATAAHAMAPGQVLALIGEHRGGCTGSDHLFDILERDFTALDIAEAHGAVWQFPGIHDHLAVFRKR